MITTMGLATATRTDARPARRPFGPRLAKAGLAVLIMVVIPSAVTWLIAGHVAVIGTLLGVVSGLLGALKSGTARAAHVVPASGVLAFIAFSAGTGWWWVALLGGVGAVAGALQWRGYLPAVAYAALLAIVVPEAVSLGDAAVIGIFAIAGGTLGVLLGRRAGAPARTPLPDVLRHRGDALRVAVGAGAVAAAAAVIAVLLDLQHGYWIPLTVFCLAPAALAGDHARFRDRLWGTAVGVVITLPLTLVPVPATAFRVMGLVAFAVAIAEVASYFRLMIWETMGIILLVSPMGDLGGTSERRLIATVIGIALMAVGCVVIRRAVLRLPPLRSDAEVGAGPG